MTDKTLKKSWIEALRSGEYEQTTEQLKLSEDVNSRKRGFCCLGVLCDISNLGYWYHDRFYLYEDAYTRECELINKPPPEADEYGEPSEGFSELHEVLLEEIGLTSFQQTKLIQANDDEDKTFQEIADMIEKGI